MSPGHWSMLWHFTLQQINRCSFWRISVPMLFGSVTMGHSIGYFLLGLSTIQEMRSPSGSRLNCWRISKSCSYNPEF
jgi:hypothetical protein